MLDIAQVPDYEPDPIKPADNTQEAEADYMDDRTTGLLAFDKKTDAAGKQLIFYRAKEFPVKKYDASDATRNDFATTVYWNGNVTLDHSGRGHISFTTNDLISSFKATVEGFAADGSIGRAEAEFTTNQPLSMDVKLPAQLVSGDKMLIPVFLKNSTAAAIAGKLQLVATEQLQLQSKSEEVVLPHNGSKMVYVEASATGKIGDGTIEIKFLSDKYHDDVIRPVHVSAKGFPACISLGGQDMDKEFVIHPENVVPGSMKVSFTAYPNIMSELMNGVASILREPNGCFEQTSSSNYPNILALQYLKLMNVKDPALETKATALLDKGYKKLTAFETKENGYEWFGAAPPHEALTAYGLMEFKDMAKVYSGVDPQMVSRTASLLLSRRDGEGGFKKNPRALDAFGRADDDITNAYIVYALSEAGYKNEIKKEVDALVKSAKASNDPYIMSLCAITLFNTGDFNHGEEMLLRLLDTRNEANFWTGKKHSITRSTGQSLTVETTSLALLALLKSPNPDDVAITGAVKFLVSARNGAGGFGSTQATILALKALTAYAEFTRQTDEAGTVTVYVNGIAAGSKDYAKGEHHDILISGLEKYINDGKQKVEIRFKGCSKALPYAMNVEYSTLSPVSSKDCAVNITTKLAATEAKVGETVRLSALLKNTTAQGQPMTMALIGLPAGFSAQPWQLKEMQEKGVIDFYEITGNNIACYYRSLAPNAEKQINLDLKAEIPGEYNAPASSAYLYYTNELKSWAGVMKVSVKGM
jgi:uncharacterized protein YfaS (alpha-2-macroglobulin family)